MHTPKKSSPTSENFSAVALVNRQMLGFKSVKELNSDQLHLGKQLSATYFYTAKLC